MKSFGVLFNRPSPSTFFRSKFNILPAKFLISLAALLASSQLHSFPCFSPECFLSLESLYLSVPCFFVEKYFSSLFQLLFRQMKAYLISLFLLEPYSIKYPLLFGVLRNERFTSVSTLSCFNKNGSNNFSKRSSLTPILLANSIKSCLPL